MEEKFSGKMLLLAAQHVIAMFGATVLVPLLTGLNSSLALLCAGLGTLLFHAVTKGIVPVFLGSSFAFIGAIAFILSSQGLAYVKGGLIVVGIVYVIFAILIKLIGNVNINKILPPIVTGPIIIVIGLRLSGSAISSALYNSDGAIEGSYILITLIVLISMIFFSVKAKGFFKLVPILLSMIIGYLVSMPFGLIDLTMVKEADWLIFTDKSITSQILTAPKFSTTAIVAIAPVAIVTVIEHLGDITTNSAVVGKNFIEDPGVHRTLLGDGLATMLAGFIGGPANTTYGENTGVLAVTKMYNPLVIRLAAVIAVILGCIGKFGALIQTIPDPVRGSISIILFGMISSVGIRIILQAQLDFSDSRNLMIASLIFVLGIGIADDIPITDTVSISGLAIAAVVGIVLALILPENKKTKK